MVVLLLFWIAEWRSILLVELPVSHYAKLLDRDCEFLEEEGKGTFAVIVCCLVTSQNSKSSKVLGCVDPC